MTDFLDKALNFVRTTEQKAEFVSCLRELDQIEYLTSESAKSKAREQLPAWVLDFLEDKETLRELKKINDWPETRLKVAFKPSSAVIIKISDWIRQNLLPNMIIDFGYDLNLGSGVIIEYGGKIADYSLKETYGL